LFKHKKDVIIISRQTLDFFEDSESLSSKYIQIKYFRHDKPMLGIRISKKAVPLAVNRNRLRRILRETFRAFMSNGLNYCVVLTIASKIPAEKKVINDILLPEWISLLKRLV
tara:strand:- start:328 stop:663 length:336 start_codon:yes stop_codon:yes gene_type:complete